MSFHTHFFIELFFQFYQTILAFGHKVGLGILAQLLPFYKNNPKTMKINVRIILITGQTILMIFIIFHAISWPKRQKHSHLSVIIFVFKTHSNKNHFFDFIFRLFSCSFSRRWTLPWWKQQCWLQLRWWWLLPLFFKLWTLFRMLMSC